jgi:hypothetical protein
MSRYGQAAAVDTYEAHMRDVERMHTDIRRSHQWRVKPCKYCGTQIIWMKKGEHSLPVEAGNVQIHKKQYDPKTMRRHTCEEENATRIWLTESDIRAAREYERKVLANVAGRSNYTGQYEKGRYFVGHCGEIAVATWCEENHIAYSWKPLSDGRPDKGDIKISVKAKTRIIDVKTSRRKSLHMEMPVAQYNKYQPDIYLAVKLQQTRDGTIAILQGWIIRRVFLERSTEYLKKVDTGHKPYLRIDYSRLQYPMAQLVHVARKDESHRS